jgi:hypothetical protein
MWLQSLAACSSPSRLNVAIAPAAATLDVAGPFPPAPATPVPSTPQL